MAYKLVFWMTKFVRQKCERFFKRCCLISATVGLTCVDWCDIGELWDKSVKSFLKGDACDTKMGFLKGLVWYQQRWGWPVCWLMWHWWIVRQKCKKFFKRWCLRHKNGVFKRSCLVSATVGLTCVLTDVTLVTASSPPPSHDSNPEPNHCHPLFF